MVKIRKRKEEPVFIGKTNKKKNPVFIGHYKCGAAGCNTKTYIYKHNIYLNSYSRGPGPFWDYCSIAFDCPYCKKTVIIPTDDYLGNPLKLPEKEMKLPPNSTKLNFTSSCTIL